MSCPKGKDGFAVSVQDHWLTTCNSNLVSVVDVQTGTVRHQLVHDGKVSLVVGGAAGQIAVFQYNKLLLWRADSGRLALGPVRFPKPVGPAAFSADGQQLVFNHGSVLEVIDTTTGDRLMQRSVAPEVFNYLHFSPQAPRFLAVSDTGPTRLWNVANGQPIGRPLTHDDEVWVARFSGQGRHIITWGKDRTVRVWNAEATERLAEPIRSEIKIVNAEISPDGRHVAAVSTLDPGFSLWRLPQRTPLFTVASNALPVEFAGTNGWPARRTRADRRVLVALGENTAQVADADTGQNPSAPMIHQGPIRSAAFSADEEFIVTASADSTARLWDAQTGLLVGQPYRHGGAVNSAVLSPDGARLLTASDDGTARVWDVLTGWPVSEPLRGPSAIHAATFSGDLRQVILAGRGGSTCVVPVPLALSPAPAWLPDLAEVVAQKKVGDQYTFQRVPPEQIFELQQRIARTGGDDFYARWAKWFFALPGTTNAFPITP